MKFIKNNKIYVQQKDLFSVSEFIVFPNYIWNEVFKNKTIFYGEDDEKYIEFKNEESIIFFKDIDCIIDINWLISLTEEQIENEIEKCNNILNKLAKEWLKLSIYERKNIYDYKTNDLIEEKIKYKKENLMEYKNNTYNRVKRL